MSFDKKYPKRKDHRKPYYDSRRFDYSCRNHGSCSYCCDRRTFANERRKPIEYNKVLDFVEFDQYNSPILNDEDVKMNSEEKYIALTNKMDELSKLAYEIYGSHSYYAGVLEGLMKSLLMGWSPQEETIDRFDNIIRILKAQAAKGA